MDRWVRNTNIRNFDDNGNPGKFSEILLAILTVMYQFERDTIKGVPTPEIFWKELAVNIHLS